MTDELYRSVNPDAGTATAVLRDEGRIVIQTRQVTAPVLEANKVAQSLYDPAHERKGMRLRWAARLPALVVMQLEARGIMRGPHVLDEDAFLKFLDDPENRYLRTDNGRRLRNLPGRGRL